MEEHDENNVHASTNTEHGENQSPPVSGQVMDVTAPQSTTEETQTASTQETSSSGESNNSYSPDTTQSTTESSSTESAPTTPESQAESSSDASKAEITHEQPPLGMQEQSANGHKPQRHGMPVIAIVIAVVVAIILAGLVVFAYTKNNSGDINRKATTSTNKPAEVQAKITTTDVDNTTKEIDTALGKTNATTDFPEAELSDASLGL